MKESSFITIIISPPECILSQRISATEKRISCTYMIIPYRPTYMIIKHFKHLGLITFTWMVLSICCEPYPLVLILKNVTVFSFLS